MDAVREATTLEGIRADLLVREVAKLAEERVREHRPDAQQEPLGPKRSWTRERRRGSFISPTPAYARSPLPCLGTPSRPLVRLREEGVAEMVVGVVSRNYPLAEPE